MSNAPLLYYRTKERIEEYRRRPALQKLKWLEAQMEFFYYAMSDKAKKIRDRMDNEPRKRL
ncbi:MAG: hypothetical protein AABZ10_11485 [Nitrospirota bacterium]|jgi:hypothetical protein